MKDQSDQRANEDRREPKGWLAPQVRSMIPSSRTRGASGEQNGNVDDVTYDLS
jgi:hypothetical protein